jgi:hypothetical protein
LNQELGAWSTFNPQRFGDAKTWVETFSVATAPHVIGGLERTCPEMPQFCPPDAPDGGARVLELPVIVWFLHLELRDCFIR